MIALAKKRDGVIYDQYTASVNYKKFISSFSSFATLDESTRVP